MPTLLSKDAPFFEVGGTLSKDAPCYVVRPADQQLIAALQRREFCYVLTSRQMGKSSLMIRTTNLLREEGVAVVILDLTRIGAHNITIEQWYVGMLAEVGRSLDIRKEVLHYWKTQSEFSPTQRFFGALRDVVLPRVPGPIVLFVDEVDTVRSLPFSADEFFAGIRECYTRRAEEPAFTRLVFGLFGVASPSDLIQDHRVTPFNIGTRIELTDFSLENALGLADALGPNGRIQLQRVFYWTGGHPYLTLRLCRTLAEDTTTDSARHVDQHAERLFFCSHGQETDDNLLFVRRWLLESGTDQAAVLDLYRQVHQGKKVVDDETRPVIEVLHLSGIVTSGQRLLAVRNRLYERVFDMQWIREHMPDAERRRQRAAFRRGVTRTVYLTGSIAVAMLFLALYAFSESRRAEKLATIAQQQERTAREKERLASANEKKAMQLARKLTELTGRLARSERGIAEASSLRRQMESLSHPPPSPEPTLLPIPTLSPTTLSSPLVPTIVASPVVVSSVPPPVPSPAPSPVPAIAASPEATSLRAVPLPPVPQEQNGLEAATIVDQPEYNPPPMFKGRVFKRVRLQVTVNADGSHREKILRSTGRPLLDLYLRDYLARFQWQPALQNGKPVQSAVTYTLTINGLLEEAGADAP